MTNNDRLRTLRYALDYTDSKMIDGLEVAVETWANIRSTIFGLWARALENVLIVRRLSRNGGSRGCLQVRSGSPVDVVV